LGGHREKVVEFAKPTVVPPERRMTVPSSPTHEVTQLLIAWSKGDSAALDRLMPLV
jgi:hypothetical protein